MHDNRILLTPEHYAELDAIKKRYPSCLGYGKPAKHTLVEALAKNPLVATVCDQCGVKTQEVTS